MAYEIFISRGVASLSNTPPIIANAPSKPSVPSTASAAKRPIYFQPPKTVRQLRQGIEVARARLGAVSGACDVPMSIQPYSARNLSDTNVSRTLKEGHALRSYDQASAGAKSTRENSDMTNYGQKSEESDLPSMFSNPRGHENLTVDQPSQFTNHVPSSQQTIPSCLPLPATENKDSPISGSPVLNLPKPYHSTTPPIPSEGFARGSVDKAYRHTRASTVTSIDGNLDAFGLGGETLDVPKRPSPEPKTINQDCPAGLAVHFTLPPQGARISMASQSHETDNLATTALFLDPFRGGISELDRQSSDISELSGYVRPHAFSRHRDTLARITWTPNELEIEDDEGFESDEDCLTPPTQATTSEHAASDRTSILDFPAEILHEIFLLLQPCDFESARHTCRSWFVVSLDRKVTGIMMRRAGCSSAFMADLSHRDELKYARGLSDLPASQLEGENNVELEYRNPEDGLCSEHWLASKRLATESRMSAAWHGSSLNGDAGYTVSRLAVTETVNFQRILKADTKHGGWYGNTFTVSNCGKFLLAVSGQSIFVYSINSGRQSLQPVIQLVADKNVLKVSMDTSSRRFAVAALLEGRTGACWEFDNIILSGAIKQLEETTSNYLPLITHVVPELSLSLPNQRDEITIISEGEDGRMPHLLQDQDLMMLQKFSVPLSSQQATRATSSSTVERSVYQNSPLVVQIRPTTIYKNLGTPSDPPRSVAICPQRKCTAFGCRAGIELHWVDAISGNNLSRWFPLAAPSDHLYFLPQRSGMDSSKKLRLVSSAAGLSERSKMMYKRDISATSTSRTITDGPRRTRSMERLFSSNFSMPSPFETARFGAQETTPDFSCDHYRAIPLSDGQHMLFTDPATGLLCLGSDAPLGGPTKLVRKACMVPPLSDAVHPSATPVCYAAGFDLQWGVRIIAAYNDGRIVLYNIPSDCFERLRYINSSPDVWDEFNGFIGSSDLMTDVFMLNRENAMSSTEASKVRAFKSLQIDGALLGCVDADVESLAVDSTGGGLKAWVFHASGQATQMDIYVPKEHKIQSRFVDTEGLIRDVARTPSPGPIIKHHSTPQNQQSVEADDYFGSRVRFVGLDGCCDNVSPMCGPMLHKHDIDYSDMPRDEGISMTPSASDDEDDNSPLQVELLTDWRTESLLRPYIVNVAWIDAH